MLISAKLFRSIVHTDKLQDPSNITKEHIFTSIKFDT